MDKKKKIIIAIGVIVLVILVVAVVVILNKTNAIERIGVNVNSSNVENEGEIIDEESESIGLLNESSEDSTITDGYRDEENKVTWHVEEDGLKCPIPDGYVGSEVEGENKISTGYVIYEGTEPVTENTVSNAKTTRNQYVWVPVTNLSEFYEIDSNGKKWGILYNFTAEGATARTRTSSGYREPDVVTSYDYDSRLITLGLGVDSTHEFLMQLEKEYSVMIASVIKYEGFYIGRYETGNVSSYSTSDEVVVVQGNSYINNVTWYNAYKLCKTLSGNNENVVTGLIWGCQWDRTLIWLVESENKTYTEIVDSRTWGNHSNSTGDANANSGSLRSTGYSEYWKAANIYDLAGNVWEWTAEAYLYSNFLSGRVWRGGSIYFSGSTYPVSYRLSTYPTSSDAYSGCRAALYIK